MALPSSSAGIWLRRSVPKLVLHAMLILIGLSFAMPFFWMISTSLKAASDVFTYPIQWIPRPPRWENYVTVFEVLKFGNTSAIVMFFANTIYVATLSTLGTMISCTLVAYSLGRLEWWGRNFVFGLALATMMLPGVVRLVPTFLIFRDLKWIDTFLPLIVPSWIGGGGFYIFLLRQFLMTLPRELDEAATVDGASIMRILWQILIPLSRPALASLAIFSFLAHYNNFMGPLIYLNSTRKYTLTLALKILQADFQEMSWHLIMVLSTLMLLPVLAMFFFAQKTFIQGIQLTGIAGR